MKTKIFFIILPILTISLGINCYLLRENIGLQQVLNMERVNSGFLKYRLKVAEDALHDASDDDTPMLR